MDRSYFPISNIKPTGIPKFIVAVAEFGFIQISKWLRMQIWTSRLATPILEYALMHSTAETLSYSPSPFFFKYYSIALAASSEKTKGIA